MLKQLIKFPSKKKSYIPIFALILTLIFTLTLSTENSQAKTNRVNNDITKVQIFDNSNIIPYIGTIDDSDLDSDEDGLTDEEEIIYNTDPNREDTDYDGLLDGEEVHTHGTNPTLIDTDFDFINDPIELFDIKTDPLNPDCDYDGLLDGYEVITYKSDPLDPDTDDDYLLDFDEARIYNTYICNSDTDKDGLLDGEEVHIYNTDPKIGDTDGDGLSDFWEVHNNHDPLKKDNWDNLVGYYVVIPSVGIILLLVTVFASISAQRLQFNNSDVTQQLQKEEDKKKLFEILSNLPENTQHSLKDVALSVGCSEFELRDLLVSIFDEDSIDDLMSKFDDCIINTSNKQTNDYRCFHCGFYYELSNDFCPECLEEAVRCKKCNRALSYEDNYTACATYGLIGQQDGITGFLNVDHICENCMLSDKYSLI